MIVEKETELNFPQRDGSTKKKHLQAIAKQTGKVPEQLQVPDLPMSCLFIKWVFDSLQITRNYVDGQPQPIAQADIYYWSKLNGVDLTPEHLKMLTIMDITAVNKLVDCMKERTSG